MFSYTSWHDDFKLYAIVFCISIIIASAFWNSREDRTRTDDLLVPNQERYQLRYFPGLMGEKRNNHFKTNPSDRADVHFSTPGLFPSTPNIRLSNLPRGRVPPLWESLQQFPKWHLNNSQSQLYLMWVADALYCLGFLLIDKISTYVLAKYRLCSYGNMSSFLLDSNQRLLHNLQPLNRLTKKAICWTALVSATNLKYDKNKG